jgi:hypothetical protein
LKKEKIIDSALRACDTEIQEYQNLKQQKLNELMICVPIHPRQIFLVEDGHVPNDLSEAIVFEQTQLERLKNRISELHHVTWLDFLMIRKTTKFLPITIHSKKNMSICSEVEKTRKIKSKSWNTKSIKSKC